MTHFFAQNEGHRKQNTLKLRNKNMTHCHWGNLFFNFFLSFRVRSWTDTRQCKEWPPQPLKSNTFGAAFHHLNWRPTHGRQRTAGQKPGLADDVTHDKILLCYPILYHYVLTLYTTLCAHSAYRVVPMKCTSQVCLRVHLTLCSPPQSSYAEVIEITLCSPGMVSPTAPSCTAPCAPLHIPLSTPAHHPVLPCTAPFAP